MVSDFIKSEGSALTILNKWGLAGLLTLVLLPSGCLSSKPPSGDCKTPFEKVITPIAVHNKHELQFDMKDLEFMYESGVQVQQIRLEGMIVRHRTKFRELGFSLNGTKSCRKDGGDPIELDCGKANPNKDADDKDDSDRKEKHKFCAHVHDFVLNGSLGIELFLLKLKLNKGELRMKIHGRDHEISDIKMVVKGIKVTKSCAPPPPPPPPPKPTAPKTSINSHVPEASPTSSRSMKFEFSADQTGVTFYCSLDNAAASACTSPMTYSNLANGLHTFKVYATNSAGLSDVQAPSYSWVVDAAAPAVSIDNLASLPLLTNSGSIQLYFSSTKPGTFTCSIDGSSAVPCTSPTSYNGLGEGAHHVDIRAVDNLGTVSAPASFAWNIDQTAPVTTILAVSPAGPVINSNSLELQFAANEGASFECSLDGGAYATCSSPMSYSSLLEGDHMFMVRATDLAGNQGLASSYGWNVDMTAPVISVDRAIPAAGNSGAHNISVEFSVSEVAAVMCSFDGGDAEACTSPFTTVVDDEGIHSLVITAVDAAGNEAVPQTLMWAMDFSAPEINFGQILPSTASYINVDGLSAEILASEDVQLSAKLNGVDMGAMISPVVLSGLAEGSYQLEVSGVDDVGNASNVITHDFVVDMTAPSVNLVSAVVGATRMDSNTLTFSSSEAGSLECNIDNMGYAPCVSPMNLSGLADGMHEALVRTADLAGNVSGEASVQWIVDTQAPLTSVTSQQTGNSTIIFTLSSSEPGSTYLCSVDGGVASACSSPHTVNGLSAGEHSFVVMAVDAVGNIDLVGATELFNFRPPVTTTLIAANPSATITKLKTKSFTFTSNHADAHFICSLDGAPAVACSSGVGYSNLADGNHSFKVQAVDIFGGVDAVGATHNWTVDTVVPTMTSVSTSVTTTTITINWTTSEPTTTKLTWGANGAFDHTVPEDNVYTTTHQVKLTGLSPNTTYTMKPAGTDRAGNAFTAATVTARTAR